jgi:hypothetical protein
MIHSRLKTRGVNINVPLRHVSLEKKKKKKKLKENIREKG